MLLLIDLDNTLIDRTGAFQRWAEEFAPADIDWLMAGDQDGFAPRDEFAARIGDRFGLDPARVVTELRAGILRHLTLDPAVGRALTTASAAGFVPVIVTNGFVRWQEEKIRQTGLDQLVAAWIVSEAAGVRKPDRHIFELAAASVGATLDDGGWMIGDHPEYDIAGGAAAGLDTIWISRGLSWPSSQPPTLVAADFPAAISLLLNY
jgi:putative hydrolase of the HAD superfamily